MVEFGLKSRTAVLPSNMLTTADIVGLADGDMFVHNKAMLIIVIASFLL